MITRKAHILLRLLDGLQIKQETLTGGVMAHPSNTLYRGECTSLEEAFDLVIAEFAYEIRTCAAEDEKDREFIRESTADMKKIESLKQEYQTKVNAIRDALMKEWQERQDGWASGFADAYFSGDYSQLAI